MHKEMGLFICLFAKGHRHLHHRAMHLPIAVPRTARQHPTPVVPRHAVVCHQKQSRSLPHLLEVRVRRRRILVHQRRVDVVCHAHTSTAQHCAAQARAFWDRCECGIWNVAKCTWGTGRDRRATTGGDRAAKGIPVLGLILGAEPPYLFAKCAVAADCSRL